MRMALVKVALATTVGVATLAACASNDGFDPAVPTAVEYVNGSGQTAIVGSPLADPLTVRVTNFVGDAVAGVTVEWFTVSGGGSVSTGTSTTDADGLAQVTWVLGPIVGPQTVQAVSSLSGSPISFAAVARSAPPGGGGAPKEIRTR